MATQCSAAIRGLPLRQVSRRRKLRPIAAAYAAADARASHSDRVRRSCAKSECTANSGHPSTFQGGHSRSEPFRTHCQIGASATTLLTAELRKEPLVHDRMLSSSASPAASHRVHSAARNGRDCSAALEDHGRCEGVSEPVQYHLWLRAMKPACTMHAADTYTVNR